MRVREREKESISYLHMGLLIGFDNFVWYFKNYVPNMCVIELHRDYSSMRGSRFSPSHQMISISLTIHRDTLYLFAILVISPRCRYLIRKQFINIRKYYLSVKHHWSWGATKAWHIHTITMPWPVSTVVAWRPPARHSHTLVHSVIPHIPFELTSNNCRGRGHSKRDTTNTTKSN